MVGINHSGISDITIAHCAAEGGEEGILRIADTAGDSRAAKRAAARTGECRANFSACEGDARVRRPRGNE